MSDYGSDFELDSHSPTPMKGNANMKSGIKETKENQFAKTGPISKTNLKQTYSGKNSLTNSSKNTEGNIKAIASKSQMPLKGGLSREITANIGKKSSPPSTQQDIQIKPIEEANQENVIERKKANDENRKTFYDRVTRSKFSINILTKINRDEELSDEERYFILISSGNLEGLKVFVPYPPESCAIK